jgi:hypothetical protein
MMSAFGWQRLPGSLCSCFFGQSYGGTGNWNIADSLSLEETSTATQLALRKLQDAEVL